MSQLECPHFASRTYRNIRRVVCVGLRPVFLMVVSLQRDETTDSTPPAAAPSSGIVGALMEVMQKRSKAIHSSGTHPSDPCLFRAEPPTGDF